MSGLDQGGQLVKRGQKWLALEPWSSKCGPWASNICHTSELLESQAYPRPSESELAREWYVYMKVGEVMVKIKMKRKKKVSKDRKEEALHQLGSTCYIWLLHIFSNPDES